MRAPSGAAIGRGRGERSTAPRSAFVSREDRNAQTRSVNCTKESSLFVPLAFHHFLPFAAFSERCARVSRGENFLSLGDLETRAAEGVAAFSSALFDVFFSGAGRLDDVNFNIEYWLLAFYMIDGY